MCCEGLAESTVSSSFSSNRRMILILAQGDVPSPLRRLEVIVVADWIQGVDGRQGGR